MKDGIINIYKPGGMTSNDVIYKVRAALGIKKLGHTGTLDPMAEGVLPILINRGTRIAEYLDWDLKTYETLITLGVRTDSLDITGNVTETADCSGIRESDVVGALIRLLPSAERLNESSEEGKRCPYPVFSGVLTQIPPMTSAVRIDGRRLYDYVHSGEEIPEEILKKIRPRKVWIDRLEIEEMKLPDIRLKITCSKGTYIRAVSRDIGEILGCGAVMAELRRTGSGAFSTENAVTVEELLEEALTAGRVSFTDDAHDRIKRNIPFGEDIPGDSEKFILGMDFPLTHFGEALVSPEDAKRFLDGWHLNYREAKVIAEPEKRPWIEKLGGDIAEYDRNERAVNTGSHGGLKLHPEYMKLYKIYYEAPGGKKIFAGIAKHSDKYRKLVPEKVFMRPELHV